MKQAIAIILAVLITVGSAFYQRITGPSYPKPASIEWQGIPYEFKLPRSCETSGSCEVVINAPDTGLTGRIIYKQYPTDRPYDTLWLTRSGGQLKGALPSQPPAGKLFYFVELGNGATFTGEGEDNSAIVRFRGAVPMWILIPHIALMFLAMLFSNLAGLQAAFKIARMKLFMYLTLAAMLIGGFIFGPIMQQYSFGEFWTGIPFGWDLTDNKTLFAMLAWLLAFILNLKKRRPAWIIIAALITLIIYCIPHSMFGSELNYSTGGVTTG